jgi:hypothetical protein
MSFRFDRLAILITGIVAVSYFMQPSAPVASSQPSSSVAASASDSNVAFGSVGVLHEDHTGAGAATGNGIVDVYTTVDALLDSARLVEAGTDLRAVRRNRKLACQVLKGAKALHIGGTDGLGHAFNGLVGALAGNFGPGHTSHIEIVDAYMAGCTGYVMSSQLQPE